MPLLSIVIPVYNVEDYLEECLNSILKQDFNDYEVILVDDGSEDRSGHICDEYAKKYSNFKVFHLQNNSLLGAARNVGLKNANGKYVHFCDADDYYISDSLKFVAKELKNNSSDVIIGHFICKPEKGAFVCNDMKFNFENPKNIKLYEFIPYYLNDEIIIGIACRFIIKRQFLLQNKLYFIEGYFAEDAEWVPRMLCSTNNLYEIERAFYCYRPRKSGSISSKKTYLHSKSYLKVVINLIKFSNEKGYNDIKKDFIYSQVHNLLGLFHTLCDTLNKNQIKELAEIIDIDINKINNTKEDLFDFINKYGSYNGLCLYRSYVIDKTLEKVYGKEDKDIYIFPTGHNGEGTARILKNAGYKVKGFLDNSDTKNGTIIEGLEVNLPSMLKNLDDEKLSNTFIIISTQKKQIVEILRNQLKGFNITDDQIIIRIY